MLNSSPLPEFNSVTEVGSSVANRWAWLNYFDMFIMANAITDGVRKRALSLYMGGSRVREIFSTLRETGDDDDFDAAKTKLNGYSAPQQN